MLSKRSASEPEPSQIENVILGRFWLVMAKAPVVPVASTSMNRLVVSTVRMR